METFTPPLNSYIYFELHYRVPEVPQEAGVPQGGEEGAREEVPPDPPEEMQKGPGTFLCPGKKEQRGLS